VDGALVMLWRESWFGSEAGAISFITNGAEQLFLGYIAKDTIVTDSEHGTVSFEAHAMPGVMKTMNMQALSIHAESTLQYWFQMPTFMTMRHMLYWLLYWHSNVLELTDWFLPASTIKKKLFSFNEGSLYSQAQDCAGKLLAQIGCDWAGRMFVEQDVQLLPTVAERDAIEVVSDITSRDWRGEQTIIRRQHNEAAKVEVKGFAFDGVNVIPHCSVAPSRIPATRGSKRSVDGLMVVNQLYTDQLAGRLYGKANNEYEDVRMPFAGDYSVCCPFPQRWWRMSLAAGDTGRGITETDLRMLPRVVNLELDMENGCVIADAVFEPEVNVPDGIAVTCPGTGDDPPAASPPWPPTPPPGGGGSIGLPALLTFSSAQYRDDNAAEWSEWNAAVATGGYVDPFWKQKQGSANPAQALAWMNTDAATISQVTASGITPRQPATDPPNSWGDDPAPTIEECHIVRSIGSRFVQNKHYALVGFTNGSNEWRGWLAVTENDWQDVEWVTLFEGGNGETRPLWLAEDGQDGSLLYVTVWQDGTLYLDRWTTATMTLTASVDLGDVADIADIDAFVWWAGVATAPGDKNLVFVFGRLNDPAGLGTQHIVKSQNGGATLQSVIGNWGSDYCADFHVSETSGGNRKWYAVRVAAGN
jgi:hypothetical protein